MQVNIQFSTDNAAFAESPTGETVRILRKLANDLETHRFELQDEIILMDHNGNRVGEFTYA